MKKSGGGSLITGDDPNYDTLALRISKGQKDRRKQDALYVRIGRDGRVSSTPQTISEEETRDELGRADRYRWFVNSMTEGQEKVVPLR